VVETYRADQIAKMQRQQAAGKDFGFTGHYRALAIGNPHTGGHETRSSNLLEFKTQFIDMYYQICLMICTRYGDPRLKNMEDVSKILQSRDRNYDHTFHLCAELGRLTSRKGVEGLWIA
jgi:hypothetical protein